MLLIRECFRCESLMISCLVSLQVSKSMVEPFIPDAHGRELIPGKQVDLFGHIVILVIQKILTIDVSVTDKQIEKISQRPYFIRLLVLLQYLFVFTSATFVYILFDRL
jgi:hypothetical protein